MVNNLIIFFSIDLMRPPADGVSIVTVAKDFRLKTQFRNTNVFLEKPVNLLKTCQD